MTNGERIVAHIREHGCVTAPECLGLFGIKRGYASSMLVELRDAGVIVPLPGRYPRRYAMARDFADELPNLGAGRVV